MDSGYIDKLDDRIPEESWESKMNERGGKLKR